MGRTAIWYWGIPLALGALVLARQARQAQPAASHQRLRYAPALVAPQSARQRLIAADNLRPAVPLAEPPLAIGQEFLPRGPGGNLHNDLEEPPTYGQEQPFPAEDIVYPIVEASSAPLMARAWSAPVATQQVPAERITIGAAQAAAASPSEGQRVQALRHAIDSLRPSIDATNARALKLAQRGALYSARAELVRSLQLLCSTLDLSSPSAEHAVALNAALAALDEADDFAPRGVARGVAVDDVVRPHRTPILKGVDVSRLDPATAQEHYLTYARQQLSVATDRESCAAQSLYLLGKVHSQLASQSASQSPPHVARAFVFHHSALAIDPRHHQAANELGVLLARRGDLAGAKEMLLASVSVQGTRSAWKNLAAVHDRLGERELAALARNEASLLGGEARQPASEPAVQWLDAATFAALSPAEGEPHRTLQQAAATTATERR